MKLRIVEDNGNVVLDEDIRFIIAAIDIDEEKSCDLQYGYATQMEQAEMVIKLLMMIQDIFDEDPVIKNKVDNLMSTNYEMVRKIWEERE